MTVLLTDSERVRLDTIESLGEKLLLFSFLLVSQNPPAVGFGPVAEFSLLPALSAWTVSILESVSPPLSSGWSWSPCSRIRIASSSISSGVSLSHSSLSNRSAKKEVFRSLRKKKKYQSEF